MRHKCGACGGAIPADRVKNAEARGYEPKWCSPGCSSAGNAAAYYKRNATKIAARRRARRRVAK